MIKNLAYAEQMTVWRQVKEKDRTFFTPRRHDPSRQMWRDFGNIFVDQGENVRKPGIVSWYDTIAMEMHWKKKGHTLSDRVCTIWRQRFFCK